LASGGLLLMMIGGLGVYLRAVPETLWDWLVSQTTMMITVKDDDAAFVWVKEWLLEQNFLKRIRRVDLDTTIRADTMCLIPAPGWHWFWHGGRPFTVYFYRSSDVRSNSRRRFESLTFRTVGRNQKILRQLIDDVVASHERSLRMDTSLFVYDDSWSRVQGYAPRSMESVILKPGEKEHLLKDVERFRASRQRYSELGVPSHRGYLLFGLPGTGKTSLVSALSRHFGMSIYAVNLVDFNDRSLVVAIHDIPRNSIILFEDIDCMGAGKAREGNSQASSVATSAQAGTRPHNLALVRVTLSGLLNVLDGFSAPENVLFVMTTNHIEMLDGALLRPGRIDYRLYMGHANDQQKVELYRRFFPDVSEMDAIDFVESSPATATMAEFQGQLLGFQSDRSSVNLVQPPCAKEAHPKGNHPHDVPRALAAQAGSESAPLR
jgi:chaperone BCS1